jgi:hypothetical protein
MHFEGLATRWLQFVHHRIRTTTWTELCSWIHNRFGRDQHESLIRQLLYIKQSGSIQEYIDQFSELIDQLLAYEHSASNNRYYIAHFVDGLKDDIKYVVHVQCPCDLDTAWCLALLHEEADIARRCYFKKIDYSFKPKPSALDKPCPCLHHHLLLTSLHRVLLLEMLLILKPRARWQHSLHTKWLEVFVTIVQSVTSHH